ncbi:unnamed protein product [Microthlaspi erraticum]|uniref:Elicitor peptide 1 n=1 Tax=Microthlaspi erraticum TaxID=1685480 RepID=A0A6D2J5C7_9BRAS|nr:unnamed protein product [Microthlaspi erraticum]
MEKERQDEVETNRWFPCQFLDQTLRAIFRCLGLLTLLHHDSPTTTKTAPSPVTLNQPEEDVGVKDDVVVTTRATKVKAKIKEKEKVSTGRSGQHN